MAKSYIEEFFIGIGFDTGRVKKESREIDKLLDGIANKKRKSAQAEAASAKNTGKVKYSQAQKEQKLNDMLLKNQRKLEISKRKEIDKTSKVIAAARVKQSIRGLTDQQSGKSAKDSASVFQSKFKLEDDVKKAEQIKDEAQRKRYIRRKKNRAEMARKRRDAEAKAAETAKKDLLARLKIYKKKKAQIDKETPVGRSVLGDRVTNQARSIERSSAYQNLKQKGNLGNIDARMKALVSRGDVEGLKDLKAAIGRTNAAMNRMIRTQVGLRTVQNGLTDSTRNMIRTYASVFALFQGTVAIKRVGQDFQGMEASMLAASGSAPAAAEDLAFINGMVDEMGLSLKDTADAFVKFKFAAKGKMGQTEIESLFQNVSMFGTALKVAPEDMKRAHRALSQMMSKGKIMSEELKLQ